MKATRKWLLPAVLSVTALAYLIAVYSELGSKPGEYHDFMSYYVGARQLLLHRSPYAYHSSAVPPIAEPPTWLLIFEPLAAIPIYQAYWLWFWINLAALFTSLFLLIRESTASVNEGVGIAAIAVMFPPIASNLWFGQSEIIISLILVLMLISLRAERDELAGLLLSAASLLRAFPLGLIGYLAVCRRWKALGWTAAGLSVGSALTVWFVGWQPAKDFISATGVSSGAGLFGSTGPFSNAPGMVKHPANLNLGWFVKWLYDRKATFQIPTTIKVLSFLAEASAIAVCIQATLGTPRRDPGWRAFGLWMVTIIFVSPLAWYFYLCCFLPVVVEIFSAATRGQASRRVLYSMIGSFGITTLLPPWGHPFAPAFHRYSSALLQTHSHIAHVFGESEFASLVMAWMAAYWFVRGAARSRT